MYNQYIPQNHIYERISSQEQAQQPPRDGQQHAQGKGPQGPRSVGGLGGLFSFFKGAEGEKNAGGISGILKRFGLDGLDAGDILLILILIFLLIEGDNKELILILGLVLFLSLRSDDDAV